MKPKFQGAALCEKIFSYCNNESKSDNKELGALLSSVATNHQLLQSDIYRTPAELAVKKFEAEEGHIRNQRGAYTHTFNRLDLLAELELLFSRQQALGNPFTSAKLLENLTALLMWQKPALSGEQILKMLGKCTFEPEEYKAAKNSYSAERFVWLTKLNNLRIQENGLDRSTGSIVIKEHDMEATKGKNGIYRIGVKLALSFEKYHKRLVTHLPEEGSIRCLAITEKQFSSMEILVGEKKLQEKKVNSYQLLLF